MNLHTLPPKKNPFALLKLEKSRLDVSTSVIKCMYCDGKCIKNGKEKNGQQRYLCKNCKKSQQAV